MFVFDRLLQKRTGEQTRYTTLLWSLVILFLLYPVVQRLGLSRFWSLFFIAELLFAVYSVSEGMKSLKIAALLVTPAILGELSFFFLETRETHWFSVISVGVFLGYVAFVVYKTSVFSKGRMTPDRVAGAIAVYLLLGLLWALVYGMDHRRPIPMRSRASRRSLSRSPEPSRTSSTSAFVTLTTLGYGDMSPVSPFAKTLAWFEAVFGQLYLAVTIARLVSLEVTHSAALSDKDDEGS